MIVLRKEMMRKDVEEAEEQSVHGSNFRNLRIGKGQMGCGGTHGRTDGC
jgi:hypothetical protein